MDADYYFLSTVFSALQEISKTIWKGSFSVTEIKNGKVVGQEFEEWNLHVIIPFCEIKCGLWITCVFHTGIPINISCFAKNIHTSLMN